jgi:hypothetical protein
MRCVNAHMKPSLDSPVDWLSTGEYLAIWVRTAPAALCPNSVMSLSSWLTSRLWKGEWCVVRYLRGSLDSGCTIPFAHSYQDFHWELDRFVVYRSPLTTTNEIKKSN